MRGDGDADGSNKDEDVAQDALRIPGTGCAKAKNDHRRQDR